MNSRDDRISIAFPIMVSRNDDIFSAALRAVPFFIWYHEISEIEAAMEDGRANGVSIAGPLTSVTGCDD